MHHYCVVWCMAVQGFPVKSALSREEEALQDVKRRLMYEEDCCCYVVVFIFIEF